MEIHETEEASFEELKFKIRPLMDGNTNYDYTINNMKKVLKSDH